MRECVRKGDGLVGWREGAKERGSDGGSVGLLFS